MVIAFLITLTPFMIQAFYIYTNNLGGASTFAIWRGLPGADWIGDILTEFLSPVYRDLLSIPVAIHLVILMVFGISLGKRKNLYWFIPLSAIAYLLTFYHFSGQYAIRIHLFLSLFMVASTVSFLRSLKGKRYIYTIPLTVVVLFSIYSHYNAVLPRFTRESTKYPGYKKSGQLLWQNLDIHLEDNSYIFCEKHAYRDFVMPYKAVHSLGAYKTMEYFQLNPQIASQLENDYNRAMAADDIVVIEEIAARYDINTAVVSGDDFKFPLFITISENWKAVYQDKYFVIFKKPG
ncbi:MAG: hypothetical protein GY841_15165 [FCB group bacterium]|nr:hypothetical protein [FCB group bacterium]